MKKEKNTLPPAPVIVPNEQTEVSHRYDDVFYTLKPDAIVRIAAKDNRLKLFCKNGFALELQVLSDSILRVRYAWNGEFERDFSYGIDPDYRAKPPAFLEWKETDTQVRLATENLEVLVDRATASVDILDRDGHLLSTDTLGFVGRRTILQGVSELSLYKAIQPDEHFYGLGDKSGSFRLNGSRYQNWNSDAFAFGPETDALYKTIPFIAGLRAGKAYGLFFDNSYRSTFDIGQSDASTLRYAADGGELNYYFIAGPKLSEVVCRYTELTGKPELPPIWALGFHQCRWSYYPAQRVRDLAAEFRSRQIPCDALYLDIDYMDGYRCFTWNRDHFPDPKGLLEELRAQNFQTVVMIDPGLKIDPDYAVYRDGLEKDLYCRRSSGEIMQGPVWPEECVFPDYTRPEARAWWGEQYRELYVEQGVAGFWNDMNEPAVFKVNQLTFPNEVMHNFDGQPSDHRRAHNIYGQQMSRATYEGLKALQPAKRPFVITRATYSGGQRFASAWTGDNVASWEHLQLANLQCQRMSLSGYSFIGTDIGGFVEHPSPELFVRWIQLGSFHPLFRVHSMGNNVDGAGEVEKEWVEQQEALNRLEQEPWSFGEEATNRVRKAIELRYQLLPYFYSCFHSYCTTGAPFLRHPLLEDQQDEHWLREEEKFFIGSRLFVSPVVRPGQKSQQVYLPEGNWFDFYTDRALEGKRPIRKTLQPDHIPLFVRAGTVLPMHPVRQSTSDGEPECLYLRVYLGSDGHAGNLYEDAGEGYAYEQGAYRYTQFSIEQRGDQWLVSRKWEGNYTPGYSEIRVRIIGHSELVNRVLADGIACTQKEDGWYVAPANFRELEVRQD